MQRVGVMLHAEACCRHGAHRQPLRLLLLLPSLSAVLLLLLLLLQVFLLLREPGLELCQLTQALLQCCNS
jgi:hypothetical protein